MVSLQVETIRDDDIKRFIEENPGIDFYSFDFYNKSSVAGLTGRRFAAARMATSGEAALSREAELSGERSASAEAVKRAAEDQPLDSAVQAQLLSFQRMLRVAGNSATAQALQGLGLDSAARIAGMSPSHFIAATREVFGDDTGAALAVHARAGHIKTAALQLYGSVKDLAASPYYRDAAFNSADPQLLDYFREIPSYTSLFGNMNYFETDPGQTIFSPSAYFFDLMRITDEYVTYPNTSPVRTIPPGYTLEERRPDLFTLKLTPENTFGELPTLSLINKVLAYSITNRGGGEAYQYLALAPYPFDLPFNRPLAALRAALDTLQCPLAALYGAMVVGRVDADAVQPMDVARETLGLSVTELARAVLVDASVAGVTRAYGYDIPSQKSPFAGAGIVGTVAGATGVTGMGSRFRAQIAVGDAVTIGAAVRKVTAIADDGALTVDTAWATGVAASYIVAKRVGQPQPPFPGTGTVAISQDDSSLTGTGTRFTAQITVGDQITAANQTRTVTAIASDTSLTVNANWPYLSEGLAYTVTPATPRPVPPYTGRGAVMFAAGQSAVLGLGTTFRADFAAGDEIRVGAASATVAAVASDTGLTVTGPWAVQAGADYGITPAASIGTVEDVLPLAGTGTVSFEQDKTRLTGTGTSFVTQLQVGDQITAGGITRTIVTILSATQAELDVPPGPDSMGLPFTILRAQGLDLVDVFLARTGLAAEELTELLRQNLDDAELAAGGAAGFFINATGEAPATITTYFCNDPRNPNLRLSGLTLKRLDRLSRFIRLARTTGWSFTDLQWIMTATGAVEITEALILALGRIAGLMASETLTAVEVAALFGPLKTTGRVDAKSPQDPFDLIFNAPALLQGADPYATGSKVPFNPFRTPAQPWRISGATGVDAIVRGRLRAALLLNDADLTRLAIFVQSLTGAAAPDTFDLTLANLGWLRRLASTAQRLEWTIDTYLIFLGLMYYPRQANYFTPPKDGLSFALDGLAAQFALAHWVGGSGFSVPQIQYIVTGAAPAFPAPYAASDIPGFLADLAASAQSTRLGPQTLAVLQLDPAQAGALFAQLNTAGFITDIGIAKAYSFTYADVAGLLPVRVGADATVFAFDAASFAIAGNDITADQSQRVYAALGSATPPVLTPLVSGSAVAEAFGAATDLSFLATIFPDNPDAGIETVRTILLAARTGIDGLLNILGQTVATQASTLTAALGTFIGLPSATVGALVALAARTAPLPAYLVAFLTPPVAGDPPSAAITAFLAITARFGLVADTLTLDPVETAYFTTPEGALHLNIADLANFGIQDLAQVSAYVALRNAVGARQDELVGYFQTPANDQRVKVAALAAATAWNGDDIALLWPYFWPTAAADDANSILGLGRLAGVFDPQRRLGVRSATLKALVATSHMSIESAPGVIDPAHWAIYETLADTARGIVNAVFSGASRDAANAAIDDALNAGARDALVGNVLWWMSGRNPHLQSVNDLYKYLLLDLEVGSCATTSPVAQAISSIQLYLQRARMMQEPGVLYVNVPTIWWSWMTNYRIWEANRKIFLYPESYLEPSLRRNATPQFQELADNLLQNDPTKANVVQPFEGFIKELAVLGGLNPVGAYETHRQDQRSGEEKQTLFLIGRTRTQPYQFYFRALDNDVEWNPWYPIDLTVSGDRLSPVYAFGRLFVFWTEFDTAKSNSIADQKSNTETVDKATLKYAFYNNGEWSSVQTLDEVALINTYPSSYPVISGDGVVKNLLRSENTYWKFPYVVSTGEGMVGAGRVAISQGLGTVDGTRTQFTREVYAGDTIVCFGERRMVGVVVSDTSLVVTVPWSNAATAAEYKIIPRSRSGRFRPFIGTGKASTTAGAPLVSGTGTNFQDEFSYGDTIAIGGEAYLVILIQSDTQLLVDQNWIGSYTDADYTVVPGQQDEEAILVCYGPPIDTRGAVAYGAKVVTPNPTKNNFVASQNTLNSSVYDGLWLAAQYWPTAQNVAGTVPLSNCIFLDADLARTNTKVLFTNYNYSAAANPQPYRPELIRQYARVSVYPSVNLLADNYWSTNLPAQYDSDRWPSANSGVDLMFNVAKTAASLITIGNKPGAFLFDNVDEAFLVRSQDASINLLSEGVLRSQRPWKPNLETSQILSTGAYAVTATPLAQTKFTFLRLTTVVMPVLQARLFAGGIDRLLSLSSQYLPELPFNRFYPPPGVDPPPNVVPVASPLMDFSGAFGLYFWETFFHAPFLIADRLSGNGQFEDALTWLQYIFNPTQQADPDEDPDSAQRFWRFRPFRTMDQPTLEKILTDPLQIRRYNYDPFDPDAIAAVRPVAYAKAIVMRYVDVVLDWADSLFTQYTRESITQATNLYVFAQDLLGEKPRSLGRLPLPVPKSFNELKAEYPGQQIPQFLIDLENTPFLLPEQDNARYDSQPVNDVIAYFAVPENAEFTKYWDRVEDRLFKIRHCMNIDGQVTPLALFSPPIDPALLIQAMAAGGGSSLSQLLAQSVPYYRFSYLVERAQAMAGQLAGLNAALLSALEKKDAEALSQLTTQQEGLLLKLTTLLKEQEIADALVNGEALQQTLASAQFRQQHYADLVTSGLSTREQASLDAMLDALVFNVLSTITKTAAAIGYAVPQLGSPFAMTYGGQQIGNALNAASGVFEIGAALATFKSQQAQTLASYDRRATDWSVQAKLAGYDVAQIGDQIRSNAIRVAVAKQNLAIHEETIRQNRDRAKFLKDKFSNESLYQWMANQVARVQFQSYTLAYQLALTAQRAYQFEYATTRNFINFNYWDSAHRGLTSADGLTLALSQMQASTLDVPRLLEIERTISLMQINPAALIQLRNTGECFFDFSELLFDQDFPGHYGRVIKTLSVSIPCVVGPYQNIKATLTQLGNQVVLKTGDAGLNAVSFLLGSAGAKPPPADALRSNWRSYQEIVLSRGQDDSGLFNLNLDDSRYLPFEGTGAVSNWRLSMPKGTNRIAFDAIADVIITLRYNASDGGDAFRRKVAALDPVKRFAGADYIDCRSMYYDAWQLLFAAVAPGVKTQTLSLPLSGLVPPHVDAAKLVGFYILLTADASAPGSYVKVKLTDTLTAQLQLSAVNDMTYLFDQHGQTPPAMDRVTARPVEIQFDLAATPAALKTADGLGLSADALKTIQVILYYAGNVIL